MRIVRYQQEGGPPSLGCVEDGTVHRIDGDPLAEASPGAAVAPLDAVRLLAPCRPSKVVAVAINWTTVEGYRPEVAEPVVFVKPAPTVSDPGALVVNPFPEMEWWGEVELGVVLRHCLYQPAPEEIEDAVLGFTIGNDVTVENIGGRDRHLARSKCPDSFCPLGPWIDTDFDASDVLLEGFQGDDLVRRGRTSEQVWQWPRILEWLSQWMTLEPWDVVLTGTPPHTAGWAYAGDSTTYVARIHGLGELVNPLCVRGREPVEPAEPAFPAPTTPPAP